MRDVLLVLQSAACRMIVEHVLVVEEPWEVRTYIMLYVDRLRFGLSFLCKVGGRATWFQRKGTEL